MDIKCLITFLKAAICLPVYFFSVWSYAGSPIVFNDNGVWCWFQDERAIVHNNKLIVGSVSNGGNVEVVEYDITAGEPPVRTVLHANFQSDDHAAPAFLALPDNRILAVYATHGGDPYIRYRI